MALRMLALFVMLSFSLFSGEIAGRVVRVADGDTITILVSGGTNPVASEPVGSRVPRDRTSPAVTQHKIRLQGIDAPEKSQAFGNASRKHLSSLVAGKNVSVKYTKRDKYGRILGTVFADGKDVNLEMLKAGLAWHYKRFDSTPAYAQAEAAARAARLGLWQDKSPIEPESFRKAKRQRRAASAN